MLNIKNEEVKLQDVQVVSCTLQDLLNTNSTPIPNTQIQGQLTIPEYQRPYVWKEKQINQLLDSVIEHQNLGLVNKPMYYLGSIILHKDNDSLKIIDGQQRITTALLIQKLEKPEYQSFVSFSSTKSIESINHNLSYLKSIKARKIFEYRDLEVLSYFNLKDINVTLIVTKTEDLAYTFFETENTGGVRLGGSDIVKAHHLRAITSKKQVNYQARRWEKFDKEKLEYLVELLTKVRFWDNRKWRYFPYYRHKVDIKNAIIEEYTLRTKNFNEDISYHYSAVKNDNGRLFQINESNYKQIKQPLANGNNTLDYVNDYLQLYEILFVEENHYQIPDEFYNFRQKLIHTNNGTVFLKELFEITLITYVSRFGFYQLFEASLWLYRVVYSIRVTMQRNVREDSVHKFVYNNQLIDNIVEVFTPDELFLFLKKYHYQLDAGYLDGNSSKVRHINELKKYFKNLNEVDHYSTNLSGFDEDLVKSIQGKLQENEKI